jgi:hypothetical protein
MSGRAKNLLAFGGICIAPGPPPTAFDGTYAGVSADVSKSRARGERCLREHIPDTSTITNGAVHSPARDRWTGNVSPQGSVILRNRRAMRAKAHRPGRYD